MQITDRPTAVAEVRALRDAGHNTALYSYSGRGRYVALDLDAPIVEIVDALDELGLDAEAAEDEALRLVR